MPRRHIDAPALRTRSGALFDHFTRDLLTGRDGALGLERAIGQAARLAAARHGR